ncbi:MAG TPA: hypothetical protein VNR63_08330, partial [Gaiellaceae bacterium]|nr:hypothetical protein [Gaiellaceae bacterium]
VAPLSAGECGAFAGAWKTVALRGDADTTVESGSCYRYRVVVLDNVGNRSTSSPSEAARIDTTPPTPPKLALRRESGTVYVSGSTVFYRPGAAGSFSVEATANDPESGIAYVSFPPVAGATGGGADGSPPYESSYSWGSTLSVAGSRRVLVSNRAGAGAHADFTLAPDAVPPAELRVKVSGGPWFTVASVPLVVEPGVDGGSGVDRRSLAVERDVAPLSAGECGAFAGAWKTVALRGDADTTVESGSCYRYRVVVLDNVGNRSTSSPSEVARIDTTPPTPPKLAMKAPSGAVALSETIVYYGAAAGSFSVEAKANDPESGIAYVWFPPVAGATGGGADATSPYESGYGWIDPLATTGLQRVIASNGAGLTDAGAFTLAADFDAPTGMSIILLAGPIYKGDAVPFRIVEGTDAGSGVRKGSATVERDSALLGADGVCGPYAGSWTILPVPGVGGGADTTVERGRCYRYRVTVSDNVGNTATSAPTGDAIVP